MKKRKSNTALRNKLWTTDVLNLVVGVIVSFLCLDANPNAIYSARAITCHIVNAATSQTTLNQVSQSGSKASTEGTIRYRLRNLDLEEVQRAVNQMLKNKAIKTLPRRALIFAIDFVLIPFYGEEKNEGDTVRSKAKEGTTRFFAYASIYVILRNKRYTLAVKYCRKGESLTDVIEFMLSEVADAGFSVKRLYIDKQFYTIDVINYLQREKKIPFIIPCALRGKGGRLRELFTGRMSYSTRYTMRSKGKEATFQVNIVVKYSKGKYDRHGVEYFAYAVYGMDIPVESTYKEYRKRFGIETSHRLMNTARARTSSTNPVLRLLYVGIGFLLMNLWIYVHWMYLSVRRKGGREPVQWAFKTMLRQVGRRIEDEFGFFDYTPLPY
jgi:putative transposase